MSYDAAERAAAELSALIDEVKSGTLRMFGGWFGRPWDNIHVARSVQTAGFDLIVTFNEGEELTISNPANWEFSRDLFRVRQASRVKWRWYYYGRPKEPGNLFTIEPWIDEVGNVQARSDVDWYQPHFEPSTSKPAAELL